MCFVVQPEKAIIIINEFNESFVSYEIMFIVSSLHLTFSSSFVLCFRVWEHRLIKQRLNSVLIELHFCIRQSVCYKIQMISLCDFFGKNDLQKLTMQF